MVVSVEVECTHLDGFAGLRFSVANLKLSMSEIVKTFFRKQIGRGLNLDNPHN